MEEKKLVNFNPENGCYTFYASNIGQFIIENFEEVKSIPRLSPVLVEYGEKTEKDVKIKTVKPSTVFQNAIDLILLLNTSKRPITMINDYQLSEFIIPDMFDDFIQPFWLSFGDASNYVDYINYSPSIKVVRDDKSTDEMKLSDVAGKADPADFSRIIRAISNLYKKAVDAQNNVMSLRAIKTFSPNSENYVVNGRLEHISKVMKLPLLSSLNVKVDDSFTDEYNKVLVESIVNRIALQFRDL